MWNWNSFVSACLLGASLLAQETPKEKIKLIEGLGKQGQNAVPAIVAYQRDPDLNIRLATVEALIHAGGVQAADALRVSCEDGSPEIQRLSVAGIVNFYKPGYIRQGVRARIANVGDKIMRSSEDVVIDPFVIVREPDVAAILKVLRNGANRDAKLQAAQALATLRARSALPDLYPLLKSKDDAMMIAALRAIETGGDKAAAQETVFLVRDLNDRIQARAIGINGVYRNERSLPDLAEVFARGRSDKSKAAALEAIALIGSPESKALFVQNLEHKESALRGLAAEGLGRIGAKDFEAQIKSLYEQETNTRARLGQAFALVRFGAKDQTEFTPLSDLFNNLNSVAWHEYAEAYLRELSRDAAVRKDLRTKATEGNRAEKIGLAKILAIEGSADDRDTIDALAHDRDPDVASEGIRAARILSARLP